MAMIWTQPVFTILMMMKRNLEDTVHSIYKTIRNIENSEVNKLYSETGLVESKKWSSDAFSSGYIYPAASKKFKTRIGAVDWTPGYALICNIRCQFDNQNQEFQPVFIGNPALEDGDEKLNLQR